MEPVIPHQPSFNPFPLALLAAAYAGGVLLANVFRLSLMLCLVCSAACTLLAIIAASLQQTKSPGAIVSLLMLAAFTGAGATLATLEKVSVNETRVRRFYDDGRIASGEPVELTGVMTRAPEWSPDGFYLTLRAEQLRFKQVERAASGVVELFTPWPWEKFSSKNLRAEYDALELRRGARVRLMVGLTRAENYRNPGVSSFTEYLERRGLDATGTIKSLLLIERLDDERAWRPLVWLDNLRASLLTRINELFSPDTAGMLNASLLGNRYGLSRVTAERFREGGTFHVLVISGLHITFIGGVVWWLMRRVTRRRAWQFAAAALFVWTYTIAVGAEASVVRAALMFSVVALAPVLHRRASGFNALGGAALGLLVWRPRDLFDPSFQLTFLSVLLITTVAVPLLQKLEAVGAWYPARATPYPPVCPRWWRTLGEILFWSERTWQRKMQREVYSYRLFKTPLAGFLERWHMQRALRYVWAAMLVSACVQIGMLPLLVIYFHRLSFASFVLNIFVSAGIGLQSLGALCALLLSQVSRGLAAPLIWLVEKAGWLMTHSVDPFTSARVASMRLPEYTGAAASLYAFYYVLLIALIVALASWRPVIRRTGFRTEKMRNPTDTSAALKHANHQAMSTSRTSYMARTIFFWLKRMKLKFAALAWVASYVLIIAHPWSAGRADGRLRIDFLDVGQGDAALITMPDGITMLIDGGGQPRFNTRAAESRVENAGEPGPEETFARDVRSIGERVVSEYLWWRGFETIDYVVATHAHADHMDGLNDVINNFRVRAALVARAPTGEEEFMRFAETARRRGVPLHVVGSGDTLHCGAVSLDVLWPPWRADANAPSGNDDSIVLRLRFGQRTFLLTGDIEARGESALVTAVSSSMTATSSEPLRSDVVKIAHHGSRTSSIEPFVAATRPALAIISAGQDSPYGHPHPEIVARWHARGAEILQTGRRGTITISTDGHDLRVETFIPQ